MLCRHHASGGCWWRGSLRSASRRPRRWPAFRPLGCRKPAFPACPDAPVLSQLTASSPWCRAASLPSGVRGRLRATLIMRFAARATLRLLYTAPGGSSSNTSYPPPPPALLSPPRLRTPRSFVLSSGVQQGHASCQPAWPARVARQASFLLLQG
jgi:hypothetical protein